MRRSKALILLVPFPLLAIMVLIFRSGAAMFGKEVSHLVGFACYWLIGCLGLPLVILGRVDFLEVCREATPLFSHRNWPAQVPIEAWHERIPDPTLRDAILDRLVNNA